MTKATSRCPLCRAPTVYEWRPFCSRYCKNVDLKRWLNEEYIIPEESKPAPLLDDETSHVNSKDD